MINTKSSVQQCYRLSARKVVSRLIQSLFMRLYSWSLLIWHVLIERSRLFPVLPYYRIAKKTGSQPQKMRWFLRSVRQNKIRTHRVEAWRDDTHQKTDIAKNFRPCWSAAQKRPPFDATPCRRQAAMNMKIHGLSHWDKHKVTSVCLFSRWPHKRF